MPDAAPRNPNPTPDAPPPPEIPDYSLLRRIGRGSYGDVWLARSVTGVFRVIKVVQRARFQDDRPYRRELEGISRFQAAVSGLPRQLALLHVGRNDAAGYFYYVMEPADDAETGSAIDPDRYVPLTLREMLKRRGRLPASECIQFVLELARGLAVLHGVGLIHRDIKPSNIILVQRVPKLADVGLVASIDATLTGVGTPGYLPPEGPGSPAADIYSLGKVLYEIATGLDQSQFPRIPRELAEHPDAPLLREINGVILKACNRFPSERHPSAEAVARDLEIIQAGRSIVLYEEFRKRSRAILIATATFATLAACAAALFVWRAQVLERANHQSRRALYRSDLAIAQLAKASGDYGRARTALAQQVPAIGEPDFRGLEWSILTKAVRGEGVTLETISKPSAVSKLAVDPAGRWAAAAFNDDRVGVWDLRTGKLARVIDNAQVLGGFLPDGRIVIDEPERAIRYERPEGGPPVRFHTERRLRHLLPNGNSCLISPKGDFIFQLLTPTLESIVSEINVSSRFPDTELSDSDITSDGRVLIWAGYKESGAIRERFLVAFDMATGQPIWHRDPKQRIVWVRCSPDLKTFAVNTGGQTPVLASIEDPHKEIPLQGHTARVQDAAFSPNGRLIATGSADQTVCVWDAQTGKLISTHRGLGRPCNAIVWLPTGDQFIAGDESGDLRVFGYPQVLERQTLSGMYSDVHGDLVFNSDGSRIAVTQTSTNIAIVSTHDIEQVDSINDAFQPVSFSPDDLRLTAFDKNWILKTFDVHTKETIRAQQVLPEGFSVDSWSLAKDQKRLAMTADGGKLAVVDLDTFAPKVTVANEGVRIWGLAFSPEGTELWTGSETGLIQVRSASNLDLIRDEVEIRDGDIQSIALSPGGKWLAVSLYNDSSVRIWNRAERYWLSPAFAHRRFVQSMLFASSGNRLISGGADGKVILWRFPEFEEVAAFELPPNDRESGDEGIAVLRLSAQDRFLAALTEDGRLQIWRAGM
jgi:WD40 repeat protein